MKKVSRRNFFKTGAAAAAVISAPAIVSRQVLASSGSVNVYAWGDYIQDNIKQAFEKETGITLNLSTYGSNEEVQNKLRAAGGKGFDLIFPSIDTMAAYEDGDLLGTIDESKVDMDQIVASIVKDTIKLGAIKRGKRIALPFNWGTEGVTYDSSVHDFKDGVSYEDLWANGSDGKSAIRQKSSLVSIVLLLDAQGVVKSNRGADVYKSESEMRRVFDGALKYAIANKDKIGAYWNNATEATSAFTDSGATIGQTWDTTGILLNKKDPKWTYAMPKEGALGWIDAMAIPSGAENLEQTYALINFLMRPEIGAMMTGNTGYNSCSEGSMALLEDKDLAKTLQDLYTEEAVANLWWWKPQTPYYGEVRQEYVEKLTNS